MNEVTAILASTDPHLKDMKWFWLVPNLMVKAISNPVSAECVVMATRKAADNEIASVQQQTGNKP